MSERGATLLVGLFAGVCALAAIALVDFTIAFAAHGERTGEILCGAGALAMGAVAFVAWRWRHGEPR